MDSGGQGMNELILKGLREVISKFQNGNTISISEEIKSYFELLKIPYKLKFCRVYDTCGSDCYSLAVSWVYKKEIELYMVGLYCLENQKH